MSKFTPRPEDRKLLDDMRRIARAFCDYHGISTPRVVPRGMKFLETEDGRVGKSLGSHWFNKFHEGVISVDFESEVDKKDRLETLFHELTHHWQKLTIGVEWYEENEKQAMGRLRRLLRRKSKRYFSAPIEIEARSFSRSIVEEI